MTAAETPTFRLDGDLPSGRVVLEASAGTGKTYTIAGLVVRYVAEAGTPLDAMLVVTFTRAATAELRGRIRTRLADALRHVRRVRRGADAAHPDVVLHHAVHAGGQVATDDVLATRERRLARALAHFDAATITTIHGFCNQVLAAVGHAGDVDGRAELLEDVDPIVRAATRDVLVASYHGEGDPEQLAARPSDALVASVAQLLLRDRDVPVRPAPDDDTAPAAGRRLAQLAHEVADRVDDDTRARGVVTFDDLLTRLRRSLRDPDAGQAIVDGLRSRYQLALVDEFQDTDPVQWEIVDHVFQDATLVLIGDPKQAIYGFRGADVYAYLRAADTPGTTRATLVTNQRSDPALVSAFNTLFDGATFGDGRIPGRPVDAAHDDGRVHGLDGPRLQVRASTAGGRADDHRAAIAQDLADQVVDLLDGPVRLTMGDGEPHRVRPGDCAVLVRTNDQATQVKEVLAQRGVHAVINGVGSVLESPAAHDWMQLLEALERPTSTTHVRALSLGPVVGETPAQVGDADDDTAIGMHDRAHRWGRILREHGVATLVRSVARETRLVERLLSQEGGDRYLTDFEHVGELLHAVARTERHGPGALLAWLVDQAANADDLPPDQQARRLESDARAVQVLTIHRSKGLQFPFVFCPFMMSLGHRPQVPFQFHDPATDRLVIDLGSVDDTSDLERAVQHGNDGEQLRLLYVALTRAQHRAVVWWFPYWPGQRGHVRAAIGRLLFTDRSAPGVAPGADHEPDSFPAKESAQRLADAMARFEPAVGWTSLPDQPHGRAWQDTAAGPTGLARRHFAGDVDLAWHRASYSALVRPVARPLVDGTPDRRIERLDEPDTVVVDRPGAGDPLAVPLPLGDQPAGATFGTMVHAVLEHVDLDADPLVPALGFQVREHARRAGLDLPDPDGLAAGLDLAARTPLGPAFGDAVLAGTPRSHRLDELEFELPVASAATHVSLAAIAEVLDDTLGPGDPFTGYPDALRDPTLARHVRGFLTGSIDLVLRRDTATGPTFHVVDHKSNRLYPADVAGTAWHYRPDALRDAMVHAHYPLQALLYQVALHRFLRWRIPGYTPERHLGAVGYLFLRGMLGPDTPRVDGHPCGVLAWRPPDAAVTGLSDLLAVGR